MFVDICSVSAQAENCSQDAFRRHGSISTVPSTLSATQVTAVRRPEFMQRKSQRLVTDHSSPRRRAHRYVVIVVAYARRYLAQACSANVWFTPPAYPWQRDNDAERQEEMLRSRCIAAGACVDRRCTQMTGRTANTYMIRGRKRFHHLAEFYDENGNR